MVKSGVYRIVFNDKQIVSGNVRYIVNNVDASTSFYTQNLGFQVSFQAPAFAARSKENVKLYLNQPAAGGAGKTTKDGAGPEPGVWNKF